MWNSRCQKHQDDRLIHYFIQQDSSTASYAMIIDAWQHDANFRQFFIGLLGTCTFSSFRWETPPVTIATVNRPFEFVIIDSPGLGKRSPDQQTFDQSFQVNQPVVSFKNLGGDARLVVPCPQDLSTNYAHLAAFNRNAPKAQQHCLWSKVGQAMAQQLSSQPVWLSTAGGGVAWLHVRLDTYPKYYHHNPYRLQD